MPIVSEKDISKYYDEQELKLMKRGSGLFPAGHYPRKERSGDGFVDFLTQGAKVLKVIKENKDVIKDVDEAVANVVSAGKKIKEAATNQNLSTIKTLPNLPTISLQTLAPSADSVDPKIYEKLRESVKSGGGFKYD